MEEISLSKELRRREIRDFTYLMSEFTKNVTQCVIRGSDEYLLKDIRLWCSVEQKNDHYESFE